MSNPATNNPATNNPATNPPPRTQNLPVCPQCGDQLTPNGRFCEACGADLVVRSASTGAPAQAMPTSTVGTCTACGAAGIDADGFCTRCGFHQPAVRDRVDLDLVTIAGVSDRGLRHHRNEDAMALHCVARSASSNAPDDVVVVVCDGVSTSDRPDDAAQAATDTAAEVLVEAVCAGVDIAAATRQAVAAAAAAVSELASPDSDNAPACTYVSAVVVDTTVTVGWIGDSRAYWLAAPTAEGGPATPSACLTSDDSWAARMVSIGLLTADEAYADRRSNALMAWLGADADKIEPHILTFEPAGPGVIIVCSDGLWNYAPDTDALADKALPSALDAPLNAARILVQHALEGGGHDNVTVAVVPFPYRTTHPAGSGQQTPTPSPLTSASP
jgi:serine/threonine protein phosphatase PrpC